MLIRGQKVVVDAIVKGERLSGSNDWAHLSVANPFGDLRFVHGRLLRQ
jgi:hypothetical protein